MCKLQIMRAGRYFGPAVKSLAPAAALLLGAAAFPLPAGAGADNRAPALPAACTRIQAPAGHKVCFHVYAVGVQIYRWDGTAWVFVAPVATLFADANYHGQVGIHYRGPTWEDNS